MYDITAYAKTVPFHPLYDIIICPIFSYSYFHIANVPLNEARRVALLLGVIWTIATIVIDLFGWVLIRHPWAMTWKEMYLDYQPWITLIYVTIFASPFIAILFIY